VLCTPEAGRNADSIYWRYETFLKRCESRLGALLGANGAIYAIRKKLYAPIPEDTLVDDLVIPLLTKLRTGCKIIYDCDAIAWEETPPDVASEFHRRARIGAGGFQSIGMLWRLLDPRRGWVAFTFLSHKVLRWFCPFFLLGMLASNVALAFGSPFYRALLAGHVGFYAASAVMAFLPAQAGSWKLLRLTTMFTGMNLALLVGFWRWLRGVQGGAWRRTARTAEATGAAR
jgi:cellulose synthase/poly-beta-1,6-N-acetylglucosamine synthase-like glycosyltransferase